MTRDKSQPMVRRHELPATITQIGAEQVAAAFVEACWRTNMIPTHDLIVMLLAHSALETGSWKQMRCYNFGNVKATDGWIAGGGAFTYYEASENLTAAQCDQAASTAAPRTDGFEGRDMEIRDSPIQAGGKRKDGRYSVWFWPSHVQCRFRAFETLADGASAYVAKLLGRYASALAWAQAGNVEQYVRELHNSGYFTAGPKSYCRSIERSIERLFGRYWRTPVDLSAERDGEGLHQRYGERQDPRVKKEPWPQPPVTPGKATGDWEIS